jgi:hypothetical protein
MKDYHAEIEAKENSPESVETGATLIQDPTLLAKAKVSNIHTQVDSEGMCIEE